MTNDEYQKVLRVWAPKANSIELMQKFGNAKKLIKNGDYFESSVSIEDFPLIYSLKVDGDRELPDPMSCFLPEGVHGPTELSSSDYLWQDSQWRGRKTDELIIYELHVGTFSPSGDFDGCRRQLDYLESLGINAIELMPLAQCPGRWNWGYDGVALYAINCNYGRPDDLKRFVDECHRRNISVIHDVVYNHIGPEGNYLGVFGNYFSKKHGTPWGGAFDFDGPNREQARRYVIENAIFWLEEYHFDGLRLDAIHYMFDETEYSIQQEICDRVREFENSAGRPIHLIGEANIYDHDLIVADRGKRNTYSAIWADDLMHSIYSVAEVGEHLTPRAYGGSQDVFEALQHGYLYQGPAMKRVKLSDRQQDHGEEPLEDRSYLKKLIVAVQTHDSAGNDAQGKRIHQLAGMEFQKAAAPLILLYPAIPMIFMGEEFAADSPFMFFADFIDERLRKAVDKGRKKEFPNHDWTNSIQPSDERAFHDCVIQLPDADNEMLIWYKALIELRKDWKLRGVLNPNQMSVHCDMNSNLFAFSYKTDSAEKFVVAKLGPPDSTSNPAKITLEKGCVILGSCDVNFRGTAELATKTMEIQTNQSLIGEGILKFS